MDRKYARAYTEVLEILKHIPENELEKIPRTELQFYESNRDKNYRYEYDKNLAVDKQQISREAHTVIVAIYMNYFASERQKGIIDEILKQNSFKEEKIKNEKYDIDKIFEKNNREKKKENSDINVENLPVKLNTKEEGFIRKIINKIKSLFQK